MRTRRPIAQPTRLGAALAPSCLGIALITGTVPILTSSLLAPTAFAAGEAESGTAPDHGAPPRPATPPPPPPDTVFADAPQSLEAGLEMASAIERWLDWMVLAGSDSSVLFGVPAPSDRSAVQLGARSVLRLVQMATTRLDAGIEAHDKGEAAGETADSDAASRAVHARSVLLPLRAARAMLLTAALETDAARRSKIASDAARIAAAAEPVSPWADAERSLLRGVAGVLSGMSGPDAAKESLDHLAAAKKAVIEDGAPRALELELGDDIALASVLGVSIAQPSVDSAALLARVLEQPAMVNNPTARLVAAELRLRLTSPSGLTPSTPEPALAGFADEFARAERDGRDAPPTLARLLTLARAAVGLDGSGGAGSGSATGTLAALAHFQDQPDARGVESLVARIGALPRSSAWRRITLLTMLDAPLSRPAPGGGSAAIAPGQHDVRLALARAAVDNLDSLTADADRRHALKSARSLLAPLGPRADLALSERVFTLSTDAGENPRVVSGRSEWGLKEVFEAQAESTDYEQAIALLTRSDELAGRYRCAECWWRLLDTMLRDPDAVISRADMIDDVADRTLAAARTWVTDTPPAPGNTPTTGPDPDMGRIADGIERRIRPVFIDASLRLGQAEAVKPFNDPAGIMPSRLESSILIDAANARDATSAAQLVAALRRLDDQAAQEWTARLSDRAWARVRSLTHGFIATPSPEPDANAAAVLAALAGVLDRLPDDSRAAATERCAWGLLLAGRGKQAAELFSKAMTPGTRTVSLLRGLGESCLASGDDARAFAAFRDISSGLRPEGDGARDYFHSWVRMLEVLSRQNADGSKRETIAREVRRLRLLSPAGACPECAARLDAVAQSVE